MIYQNNPKLLPIIQKLGCYFLSLARMVEIEVKRDFKESDINDVWDLAKANKFIDKKDDIINPDAILKLFAYQAKATKLSIVQVGQQKDGKEIYWNWVTSAYKNAEYLVEQVNTNGEIGTHFRLCDKDKHIIYDSYSFRKYECKQIERYIYYKKL